MISPKRCSHWIPVAATLALGTFASEAAVKLHGLFTDHMVLQRNARVPVWGWADDGEMVIVEFRDQKVHTFARNGRWLVHLAKMRAGDAAALTVTGKNPATYADNNTITLTNVVVGEVWIASGQSNMEWPLRAAYEPQTAIADSANPLIRLYTVPKLKAAEPKDNVNARWSECSPATVSNFSAVAYYFARTLQPELGVPVGVIHTSWGGSPAEVWMSDAALAGNPEWKRDILDSQNEQYKKYQAALAQFEEEEAAARRDGKTLTRRRPNAPWKPTELYNGMIAPLIPYAIKGAIWYQGESNAGRAHQYRSLFAGMIENWRRDWGQGDFAFLEVQLAPFKAVKKEPGESDWAELREAQWLATKSLPKVGMAVITDVGEENDIHPRKKGPVGARLALAALHIAYGENVPWSGPEFRKMRIDGSQAILSFTHVGSGLVSGRPAVRTWPEKSDPDRPVLTLEVESGLLNWPLSGFAICGVDRKWVWADARIDGDKVVVSSPRVSQPVAVRYGWADYPTGNLWNADGLPASPFRTDDFPMITAPKTGEAKP